PVGGDAPQAASSTTPRALSGSRVRIVPIMYTRLRSAGFLVLARRGSAAQAATRHVPLKRQNGVSSLTRAEPRVYPRTCDAAFRDTIGQARGYTRFRRTGFILAGMASSMNHVSAALPAHSATPTPGE